MAAKIGPGDILFRVGSGSPSKVFLGSAAVQDVPGKPVVTEVTEGGDIAFVAPVDGGSPILGYNIYLNGSLAVSNAEVFVEGNLDTPAGAEVGDNIEIAAVNAIGEGPKSDPVAVIP
jgi:hypothetical protein